MSATNESLLGKIWRFLFVRRAGPTKTEVPLDIDVVDPFERFERAILKDAEDAGD